MPEAAESRRLPSPLIEETLSPSCSLYILLAQRRRYKLTQDELTAFVGALPEDLDDERLARNQGKYKDSVAFGDSIDASCENVI